MNTKLFITYSIKLICDFRSRKAWKEREERLEEKPYCDIIGGYPPSHPYTDLHNSTSSVHSDYSDPYDMRTAYRADTRAYENYGASYAEEDPRWNMPWLWSNKRDKKKPYRGERR